MKTFGQKINELLSTRGINTVELASILGVSQSLISQWQSDSKGTKKYLPKLAKFSGYPVEYWLNDEIESPDVEQISTSENTIYVPFFKDGVVSAGFGAQNGDLGEYDLLPFNPEDLRIMFNVSPKATIGIIPCFGNSSDLIVFCHDGQEAIEGAIYVCRYDGELFIKRFKKRPYLSLISDNKDYDPIVVQENLDVEIIGRVVGSYSINSKRF